MTKVNKLTNYIKILKGVDRRTQYLGGIFIILVLMACYLRLKLMPAETFDYTNFLLPWHKYLEQKGLSAFHDNFANYNTPYLFLLWIITLLPLGPLAGIKLLSIGFDFVLAAAVFAIVAYYRPKSYSPYIAFLATLFLPTVFLNSSLWGQCDAIYTSFGLWAFYFCLRNRQFAAWLLWGIAFSFKLQAIFFLPFLLFYSLHKRWRWYAPLVAVAAFAVLSVLPILEGRSLSSTLGIYLLQAKDPVGGQPALAWYSPTFGQLLPGGGFFYHYFKQAMLVMGAVAGLLVVSLAFLKDKFSDKQVLNILAISLFVVPFLLPGIHERYLFSAEIIALVASFVLPRFVWAAITMQIVTIITYNSYFTGGSQIPQISYSILALAVLGIICFMTQQLYLRLTGAGLYAEETKVIAKKRQ